MRTHLRSFLLLLALALVSVTTPLVAQTTVTSTTLSAAVTTSATQITIASATGVTVNDLAVVDHEAMIVTAISGTTLTVRRGVEGTAVASHATAALIYIDPPDFFSRTEPYGSCVRAENAYLPRIVLPSGNVWDCPVGALVWTLLNSPATHTVRSEAYNLDNGAGTTIDSLLIRPARAIRITACRIVYEDATTGTVAAGNARVGTTVGGSEVVASTAYANTTAVGATTAMVIVDGAIAAGTPVLVRHTGVAATQAGEAVVECDWHWR